MIAEEEDRPLWAVRQRRDCRKAQECLRRCWLQELGWLRKGALPIRDKSSIKMLYFEKFLLVILLMPFLLQLKDLQSLVASQKKSSEPSPSHMKASCSDKQLDREKEELDTFAKEDFNNFAEEDIWRYTYIVWLARAFSVFCPSEVVTVFKIGGAVFFFPVSPFKHLQNRGL